ncbi:hypothetical protein [Flavobacterium phage V157]|uniref:Uncharacterized protein n=19 Tax=Ficleduovirus TaxID=2560131 RepID=A0A7G8L420_9CAUD|nr:hypothetical protein FDG55_gp29 [Flavobacterium phage FCV-1]ASD51613.1 hypothetical protein [Flavobacterium phage FCV-3]ASD51687.1 hypothetical protein [Flavobacterium phage FCV-11]ASD51761.1 hypothetical protein [Flavobacterium phage V175]ASD51839.1 hypothetical protein [Flavobacterium phage V181]ASD52517.1 hypothetical protein [Flavobacterium phage FCV-10]ASD52590.1 hypothetical protein [Flavobacterium phage FCV-16]ASD52664.1 hypothetical protein [Flavobacterium phage FCV-20]ASD52737.1
MKKQETKINKEIAIEELKTYLSNFVDGEIDVEKEYPKSLQALMSGNLTIDDNTLEARYKLLEVVNCGSEFQMESVTFKTRVKPSDTARLAKNIDLKNDAVRYGLVVTAHIIGLASYVELDYFCKKDYQLIQELSSVFI